MRVKVCVCLGGCVDARPSVMPTVSLGDGVDTGRHAAWMSQMGGGPPCPKLSRWGGSSVNVKPRPAKRAIGWVSASAVALRV